jgi:hypothetical protein
MTRQWYGRVKFLEPASLARRASQAQIAAVAKQFPARIRPQKAGRSNSARGSGMNRIWVCEAFVPSVGWVIYVRRQSRNVAWDAMRAARKAYPREKFRTVPYEPRKKS